MPRRHIIMLFVIIKKNIYSWQLTLKLQLVLSIQMSINPFSSFGQPNVSSTNTHFSSFGQTNVSSVNILKVEYSLSLFFLFFFLTQDDWRMWEKFHGLTLIVLWRPSIQSCRLNGIFHTSNTILLVNAQWSGT